MNQNIIQSLMLLKENEKKFKGIEQGFFFLDYFLDQCEKLEKKNNFENNNTTCIIDYRNLNRMYFDSEMIQLYYNNFYVEFLYEFYFRNYFYYEKFRSCLKFFFHDLKLDEEKEIIYIKMILRNFFGCFYTQSENKIELTFLVNSFKLKLSQVFSEELSKDLSENLINVFFEEKLIKKNDQDNSFSLVDVYFFSHLKFMSLSVVKIYPIDSPNIKYSCSYGLVNLTTVISKFLLTKNIFVSNFFKKEFLPYLDSNFFDFYVNNDYFNLDPYQFIDKINTLDDDSKYIFFVSFVDKLIINSYCFHTIINSCFENYYNYNIPNILYDKSPNLRLNF